VIRASPEKEKNKIVLLSLTEREKNTTEPMRSGREEQGLYEKLRRGGKKKLAAKEKRGRKRGFLTFLELEGEKSL